MLSLTEANNASEACFILQREGLCLIARELRLFSNHSVFTLSDRNFWLLLFVVMYHQEEGQTNHKTKLLRRYMSY